MIQKYKLGIIAAIVGAGLGYLYYTNWGCTSGCTIRSSASLMTGYGAVMGYLLLGIVRDFRKKKEEKD